MHQENGSRAALATIVGFILGSVVRVILAVVLGYLLLILLFTLKPPTGDVVGMGGLIIILMPFGFIIGAAYGVKVARGILLSR